MTKTQKQNTRPRHGEKLGREISEAEKEDFRESLGLKKWKIAHLALVKRCEAIAIATAAGEFELFTLAAGHLIIPGKNIVNSR